MLCTKCGKKSASDSVFCMYCGAKLVENDNTADLSEPSFLSADSEQTMCLDEDELQEAFLEKYPTDLPISGLSENSEETENADIDTEIPEYQENTADSDDITISLEKEEYTNSHDADDTMVLEGIDELIREYSGLNENFDSESTVMLDENGDFSDAENTEIPDDIAPDIIPSDSSETSVLRNDDFFANNEQMTEYAENTENNGSKSFSDNSSTMTFTAIQDDDDFIPEPPPPPPVYETVTEPETPVYQEVRKPKKSAKKTAKIGFFRMSVAVLLSVAAFVFLFIFNVTLSVKLGASGHIVRSNITRFDGRTVLAAEYDGDELSNTLFNSLGFGSAAGGMATPSSFRDYMLRTDFLNYAGRTADNYISYIIDGDGSDPSITAQDFVYDFIKANNRASIEEFEYKMTEQDYAFMQANLEKDGFDKSMSIAAWGNSLGFSIRNLKYLFSYLSIVVFLGITLIMFIWTALAVRGRTRYFAGFYSSILRISGIVIFILGAAVLLGSAVAFAFTNQAVYYVASHALITFSLVSMCIGVAEFVLGLIFRTIKKTVIRRENA